MSAPDRLHAMDNLRATVAGIGLVLHATSWGVGLLATRACIKGNRVRRSLFIAGAAAVSGGVGGFAIAFVAGALTSIAAALAIRQYRRR